MFEEITYYPILGMPFIVHLGLVVFVLFGITAGLALLKRRGKIKYNIVWHFRLAYLSLFLGLVHVVLGLFAYI